LLFYGPATGRRFATLEDERAVRAVAGELAIAAEARIHNVNRLRQAH